MGKDSFILYQEYEKHLELLTTEQKGKLLEAIFLYNRGEKIELEPIILMAFSFIKSDLDINKLKYEAICKRRSEAGSKGGRPEKQTKAKKANAFSEKQTKAKKADNDNDNDNDSDNKSDKIINTKHKQNKK
jgi:hypothetical protein